MTDFLSAVMLASTGGLLLFPFALLAFGFWLWMIVDCARHEREGSTKILWLLAMVIAGAFAAPLYFFLRKCPRLKHDTYHPASPLYQPWRKDERIG